MSAATDTVHIAIMHDRRRAERLPRLLGWLGSNVEAVRSGLDGSITIGDGTRRGAWTAMRWCICDFLASGKPWMLLLEDDAEPTAGAVGGIRHQASGISEDKNPSPGEAPPSPSRGEGAGVGRGYWNIREACAELVRWRWNGHKKRMTIHLCCTGGVVGDLMDGWANIHPESPTVPLYGEPVGTVAMLMSRAAAERVRDYWQDWTYEREFEKTYAMTPDAGDARLWEMQRLLGPEFFPRRITVRSLVEHGCAGEGESLVREGWEKSGEWRVENVDRKMHNPITGITPLEWVRSFDKAESAKLKAEIRSSERVPDA